MAMPVICEVGPRDGLQNLARHFSVQERVTLIDELAKAGLRRIEAVSFVNPRNVPQMAGAEEVLAQIARPDGLEIAGLALNARGVERALACRLDEIRFVVVASETFSMRNQGASIAETMAGFKTTAPRIKASGMRMTGVIAAAFGCPFEGDVPLARIIDIAGQLVAEGADEIVLADTIGVATPADVTLRISRTVSASQGRAVGVHFHNTRNLGLVNAYAALGAGATILDSSVGGLGGCPFAPRATGNIATEEIGLMLGDETGLSLSALLAICARIETLTGEAVPGQLAKAGLFQPAGTTTNDIRRMLHA